MTPALDLEQLQHPNVNANRAPTGFERQRLQQLLAKDRSNLKNAESDRETLRQQLLDAEREIAEGLERLKAAYSVVEIVKADIVCTESLVDTLKECVATKAALLHPIRITPTEILRKILLYSAFTLSPHYRVITGNKPTQLAQVCRRWKRIVDDEDALWSHLALQRVFKRTDAQHVRR